MGSVSFSARSSTVRQPTEFSGEVFRIERIFNVSPLLQLCIELNIDEGTCDRAVAEALLYLEQIRTGLIVVKGLGMAEAVERVSAGFPSQF